MTEKRAKKGAVRPYHHGDLRMAVLREALAIVETEGLEACTLRDVARRIGVSHAAPYRHFPDKRALVTALAIDAMHALGAAIETAIDAAGHDLRKQFLAASVAYVRFAREHRGRYLVLYRDERDVIDLASPELIAAKERSFGTLLRFIARAQKAELFPEGDPMSLATPIWAMHHGLASLIASRAFPEADDTTLDRIVEEAHAKLLDGLSAKRKK